eukprot:TRINITY_DN2721_c0_g1_i1.p1 TRINITY_DN2721_c0_g1~~TRINITY_DN2721_c0_g1_i1.p1  ORF type:complete len:385 (-),score=104.95 TRINITY_DN2721_c0_g1_i1:71-1225(-)
MAIALLLLSVLFSFVRSYGCPALRIRASTPSCNPELFTYRILTALSNGTEVASESGLLSVGTSHSIPFCDAGQYSILITNHGANESCSPSWSLLDAKNNAMFFSTQESYIQGSQAYFTVDNSGCFKLVQYFNDFNFHNATAANSTCFAQCPKIKIDAVPKCRAAHFNYTVLSKQQVVDSGRIKDASEKSISVCAGSYSVFLYNNADRPECSPDNWTIETSTGFKLYSSSERFSMVSEASFLVDSNMCVNLTEFSSDAESFKATEKNSSCYDSGIVPPITAVPISTVTVSPPITSIPISTVTVSPPITVVPTRNVSGVFIPEQTDSSSNHFWLHTFWGIFLIVLFCLLGLLVIGFAVYTYMKKNHKVAAATEGERQPLVAQRAEA